MTPTFCASCDNVEPTSRKRQPTQWLCLRHKRLEGMGFVNPDYWTHEEPFARCRDVNYGLCPLFTPLRENKNDQD